MKKAGTLLLALVIAAGVGAAAGGITAAVTDVSVTAEAANIVKGDTSANITAVQRRLKELGYYKIAVDGIWGPKTLAAVKAFQRDYGLTVDGIVGTWTERSLGITLSSSGGGYSSPDRDLLARCVYAEAKGRTVYGAGRGGGGSAQPRGFAVLPRFGVRSHIPVERFHLRKRRADKLYAGRHRIQRRGRRAFGLGSYERLPVLLQPGDGDEQVDMVS